MPTTPTVAVLIACHNRKARTLACLASLALQDAGAALHPIIYDDASSDGTAAAIRQAHPEADILPGSGTAFWAGGMRAAFDHALRRDFDFYLWLNDDVVLDADAVGRLLDAHGALKAQGRTLCLIGGALADPATGRPSYGGIAVKNGRNPLRFDRVPAWPTRMRECDTLNGNVVLVPRDTARQVGSIGAAFIHTLGDLDYGMRVKQAGGWVGLAPGLVGSCARNAVENRWFNPALSLRARWRLVASPLGLPLQPWLHFCRTHGGPLWFAFAPLVYWRLVVPSAVAQALGAALNRWRSSSGRSHARSS